MPAAADPRGSNTTGSENSAIGGATLLYNSTGSQNSALGNRSLYYNVDGSQNTAAGYRALLSNTSGNGNVAIGSYALTGVTTGNSNIALGSSAGSQVTTGSQDILIGNDGSPTDSNLIRIGSSGSQTTTFIAGISGTSTGLPAAAVVVDANGQLGTISSSRRYKEDIRPMADASDRLLQLRPVQFRFKKPNAVGEKPIQYGLIAEEVGGVIPELVVMNKDGQPETVAYHLLPAMLLNELQKEHGQLKAQEQVIHNQAEQIAKLEAQALEVATLKARLADLEQVTALLARTNVEGGVTVQQVSQRVVEIDQAEVTAR